MAGKSLDELNLRNDPPKPAADPRSTDWFRFSQDIQDLLATGKYTWAEQTLQDIAVTVEQTQRVTDGQRRAVRNIEEAVESRRRLRIGSRRYEGFDDPRV
jgi:hypothetical protein